jgi:hypothetical protein
LEAVWVTVKVLAPFRVLPVNKAPLPDHEMPVFMKVFPVAVPLPPVRASVEDVKVFDTRFSGEVAVIRTGVFVMVTPVTVCGPAPAA